MQDDLGAANQRADLGNSGDVLAVPLHPEFEVLVGIEALRVDRELCHAEPRPNSLPQLATKLEPIYTTRPVRDGLSFIGPQFCARANSLMMAVTAWPTGRPPGRCSY